MFKIEITEIKTETKTVRGEHTTIGTEEVERDKGFYSGVDDADEPKTRVTAVYGYAPDIEKEISSTNSIFSQEVKDLDLKAVIMAVNGIGGK